MKSKILGFAAGLAVAIATVVSAATFPVFQPATGVLKGASNTYVTTAAVSADIRGLWSGVCDITTFLRGDGACAQVSLTTNVSGILPVVNGGTGIDVGVSGGIPFFNSTTQMASSNLLTANAIVLGGGAATAPATLGSLGTTTTVLHGNAAGAPTFGAIVLTTDVSGILPVANGGTNLSAAADDNIMVGNATTWQSKAVPNCTDTGGNHLNYDTSTNSVSCGTSSPGGFTGFANPTASVGLAAVNGAATTAMRSDAAPALSQAIVPTWTGAHLFNGAQAGTGTTGMSPGVRSSLPSLRWVNAAGAANEKLWEAIAVSSTQFAMRTLNDAVSANSDFLNVTRSAAAITVVALGNSTDNPSFTVNSISMTPQSGTFVATFDDACTTSPTVTFSYYQVGNLVTLQATASSGFTCTGDSTNFATTGTPIPAAIRPTTTVANWTFVGDFTDNGAKTIAIFQVTSAGNVQFLRINGATNAAWTAAGSRSTPAAPFGGTYYHKN